MAEKSLEEKVNAALEEAVVEEPVVEEVAEKKTCSKKAKKEEEEVLSPVAQEILSWNLPKTLFELVRKWAESKTEEELLLSAARPIVLIKKKRQSNILINV